MTAGRLSARALAISALLLSAGSAFAARSYETDFIKGDMAQKRRALRAAAADGYVGVALNAIDFALMSRPVLGEDDADLNSLLEEAVSSIAPGSCIGSEEAASLKLCEAFRAFSSPRIRALVIDALSGVGGAEAVALMNGYFSESMESRSAMDEPLLKAVLFMGARGNSASFSLLLIADILDVWPSYSEILSNAYAPLSESSEKELLRMLSSVPAEKKAVILERLGKNQNISRKIRGIAAENALSPIIYGSGANPTGMDDVEIRLELDALSMIADTQWTRAAALATASFQTARTQFESGRISGEQFARAISDIASVASSETASVLSMYLDSLNRSAESNHVPVKAVVLSVINSLGELGDKSAFDYLLSVTYLNYPEDVVGAAKSALARLKW